MRTFTWAVVRPPQRKPRLLIGEVPEGVTESDVLAVLDDRVEADRAEPLPGDGPATIPLVKWRGRIGRPPVGPAIQIRLTPELLSEVDDYAEANDLSRSSAIRLLVTSALRPPGGYDNEIDD